MPLKLQRDTRLAADRLSRMLSPCRFAFMKRIEIPAIANEVTGNHGRGYVLVDGTMPEHTHAARLEMFSTTTHADG